MQGSLRSRGLTARWVAQGAASGRLVYRVTWGLRGVSGKNLQILIAGSGPGQVLDMKVGSGMLHNSTIYWAYNYSSEPNFHL